MMNSLPHSLDHVCNENVYVLNRRKRIESHFVLLLQMMRSYYLKIQDVEHMND